MANKKLTKTVGQNVTAIVKQLQCVPVCLYHLQGLRAEDARILQHSVLLSILLAFAVLVKCGYL